MVPEHYLRGRAPEAGTPIAIGYLREFISNYPNQAVAAMELLGCSERTAKRLLSRKNPYKARIKVDWAHRICSAVGKPAIHVLGPKGVRLFPHAVVGWHRARSRTEALEMASDMATSIALQAMIHFGLTGHFSVSYRSMWISEVVIFLSPAPEMTIEGGEYGYHRLVITSAPSSDGVSRMWIQHVEPKTMGATDKEILTPKYLEKLIHDIYALTKDLTTKLNGKPLRRPTSKRR